MSRNGNAAGLGVGCFIMLWWLGGVGLTIGLIIAAIHFIAKYW